METYENPSTKSSPPARRERRLFDLAPGWHVADDGTQWIVTDARGGKARAEFFCVEAATITRRLKEFGVVPTPEAQERLSRLPRAHP